MLYEPPVDEVPTVVEETSFVSDLVLMTKPRLNALVVITCLMGALLAGVDQTEMLRLAMVVIGTYLLAGAAAAFNMVMEADSDALMERTRERPVPAGRVTRTQGALFSAALTAIGMVLVGGFGGAVPLLLGVATLILYLAVYTPLKKVTPWATHIGAIPGAIPPLMGFAAFALPMGFQAAIQQLSSLESLGPAGYDALVLFLVLFFWQLPHFFAIAWRYKEDYARGGLAMLSVFDRTGKRCATESLVFAVLTVLATLMPLQNGASAAYGVAAFLVGAWFVWRAVLFLRERTDSSARRLVLASVLYLPVALALLVFDRLIFS